jgi:hypothetical protein
MNDTQMLTIALATAPTMLTVLIGILINNARLSDLRSHMDARLGGIDVRITELTAHMNARFDDMRDTWRSELHRVEEVIDARLKHIEQRS